jgi:DNA-directed RNA polymerase subunit H (RpoH/RPB5)
MHDLQPKRSKLSKDEKVKTLARLNISLSQLPKISLGDPSLAEGNFAIGDIIKIERKDENNNIMEYFRVVVK